MPSSTQRALALLLAVFVFFSSGCAGMRNLSHTHDDGSSHVSLSHDDSSPQGLQKTGSSEARAAAWILVGALVALVIVVDVLLLPVTYEDPFPCCQEVITICN